MTRRSALTLDTATLRRFIRFLIVGVVNTAFGYGVYALLVVLNAPPQVALFLSFFIGVLWNYFTTARFVFEVSGYDRLPAYAACYIFVYALNAGTLHAAIESGIAPLIAQAVLTPVAAVLTFVLVSFAMREKPQS